MSTTSCSRRLLPWPAKVVMPSLLAGLLAGPALGDSKETFEDESKVILVEVPVRVVLDGQPLAGLTADDFRVFDRGKAQEITNFQTLDFRELPDNPPPSSALGPSFLAPKRNLVFLFDFAYPAGFDPEKGAGHIVAAVRGLYSNSAGLTSLVESHLKSRDRWAVAFFSPLRNVKVLQGWTESADEVSGALEVLNAAILAEPALVEERWRAWRGQDSGPSGKHRLYANLDDLLGESRTAAVRADPFLPHDAMGHELVNGMIAVAEELDEAIGPKSVVYISHGFASASLGRLQKLFKEYRTSNWTIESVSTGGSGHLPSSLYLVSYETGGQAFRGAEYVSDVLEDMFDQTALSYVLAFRSDELEPNGAYHRLKVELVDGPKGVSVIHRRGYYAPEAKDEPVEPSSLR